jgi:Asp-tRNA(Asn)/Glu-tRNA(Gln) amidotransferase A subunit family amidase
MEHLYRLSLRDMLAGIRDRRWSAEDLMRACLGRVQALEGDVQAWTHLDADGALGRAQSADALRKRGGEIGPLHGAPVAVKDIIDVAGMPTRYGSPIQASAAPANTSAACVQTLLGAGAIAMGKTVTAEFAYYTPGKTRNPWNYAHTPGGSSMGSAAAVACGMAAAALGTQTNGSIIRPAAYCGIVGFKPSMGAVPNDGTLDPWSTLDHTGVFARNVADAALVAAHVAAPGVVSPTVTPPAEAPYLALVRSPAWKSAQAAQKLTMASDVAVLAGAGARIEELDLPDTYSEAHRMHRRVMAYEGARHFAALRERHAGAMSTALNQLIDEGLAVSEAEYREAIAYVRAARESFSQTMGRYDAIITPPAVGEAPATLEHTGDPAFCTIWTLLGAPAVTIPGGTGPQGLPIGMQIVGRRGQDDRTLGVAAWCELHLPFTGLVGRRQSTDQGSAKSG